MTTHVLNHALDAVDYDYYTTGNDGRILAQTSSMETISRHLELLDVQRGEVVMEIGTGSGYSTALLAELVGPTGCVFSIDVDPDLTERAIKLLEPYPQVRIVTGDGALGYPVAGYDRIIAWATAPGIPHAWIEQADLSARIVAPVQLARLPYTNATLVADVIANPLIDTPQPQGVRLVRSGFIELHPEVNTSYGIPARDVDIIDHGDWLAAEWVRQDAPGTASVLLSLARCCDVTASPLAEDESPEDFWAFLLGARHMSITTVGLRGRVWQGLATWDSLALLDGNQLLRSDSEIACVQLRDALDAWRSHGRPGYDQLHPRMGRIGDHWVVIPQVGFRF